MAQVLELITLADLREDDADAKRISVAVRQEAVLDDGRRILLLDGRGWSSELRGPGAEIPDIWATESEHEIAEQAGFVVGPDEPFGDRTQADMERSHWDALAETLCGQGIPMDGDRLRALPRRVV